MKDFFSKLAFGFIMAQLFPGVIVLVSFSFVFLLFAADQTLTFISVGDEVFQFWNNSLGGKLAFFGLSIGFGMAIHGLQWSISAFGENGGEDDPKLSWFFQQDLKVQFLLGPLFLLWEGLVFLFTTKKLTDVILEENVPFIPNDKMEAFQFLQDFYLHFAQFYMHTSYALVFAFGCIAVSATKLGLSAQLFWILLALYLFAGFFYLVGRVQFFSLYEAEWELRKGKRKKKRTP